MQAIWGEGPAALVGRARDATSGDFAALAPTVLELADDDPAAAALRAQAVAHLADLVTTAAARLGERPRAWALAGGVARALSDNLRGALDPALQSIWRPAAGPPVAGAWIRARRAARAAGSAEPPAAG